MSKMLKKNKSLLVSFCSLLFSFVLVVVATFAWFVFKNPEFNDVGGGFPDIENYNKYVKYKLIKNQDVATIDDVITFYPGHYLTIEIQIENPENKPVGIELSFSQVKVLYDHEYYTMDDFTGDDDMIYKGPIRFTPELYETFDYYINGTYEKMPASRINSAFFKNFVRHSTRATRVAVSENLGDIKSDTMNVEKSKMLSTFTDLPFFDSTIPAYVEPNIYKCYVGMYFDPMAFEVYDGIELRNSNPYMFQSIMFTLSIKFNV